MSEVILRMENMVKTFPGTVANQDITLEVEEGEIHCLLGENGAGKTVLMSTLYGLYHPDSGHIFYKGQEVHIRSPKDAIYYRIGMVHQHFMLVPTLTVTENIILGQDRSWKVLNDLDERAARIRQLSDEFGLQIDPNALVSDLSVGEEQRVEILKALYHGVDLLILDEPTAVLTPQETTQLLSFLRNLADQGLTIIFITHKLEEVMQISDRVTILRDAHKVATVNTAETDPRELAKLMVGRDVLMKLPERQGEPGKVILSVKNLAVKNERGLTAIDNISFEVHEREVVGIAGVSGNGQTELALALAGLLPISGGEVHLNGDEIQDLSPKQLGLAGFAHVPEDRHKMAIVMPLDVSENVILHEYWREPFSKRRLLQFASIREYSQKLVDQFDVRLSSLDVPIANLSGGNQQKLVVARELNRLPRLLLVNQPTRGIDIGATEFVRQQILHTRDAGSAVLLISTELEEIFHLSDRILVMYEGKIAGELPPDRERTEEIGLMMAGKA
ncbi:MAG: ABC transporter ATP-binding protein [Candidatus Promineifilaceae bacterium]|nr:ABC transporter ATP-binding protein [Candidatus Promineifilaceae bacterium]